mmetsp:Transcript_98976/g.180589  ORF Transcript_98976/g.180589 Transcript_98976/m.180589 type:complete len:241 (-) Transcript_98976:269-991(-)
MAYNSSVDGHGQQSRNTNAESDGAVHKIWDEVSSISGSSDTSECASRENVSSISRDTSEYEQFDKLAMNTSGERNAPSSWGARSSCGLGFCQQPSNVLLPRCETVRRSEDERDANGVLRYGAGNLLPTTLMIGNLDHEQGSTTGLAEFLKGRAFRIGHEIDFLYVPRGSRFGFANFTSTKGAHRAMGELMQIGLRITAAHIQGFAANKKHYYKKATCYKGCADDRPIFHNGRQKCSPTSA